MGGGSQTSSGQQTSQLWPYQQQLMKSSGQSWQQALNAANQMGGLQSLLAPNPEQIAPLTPAELTNIGQLEGWAATGTRREQAATSQLNQLTSGPIGSSPARQAGMAAWQQNVMPTIESSISATGGGRGGDLTAALTQGQVSAYDPLVQQEIANRENAVTQQTQLGAQQFAQPQAALSAADLQRQVQQSQLSSQFQDFLRQSGLIQQYVQGPLQMLSPLGVGSQYSGVTSGTGKF